MNAAILSAWMLVVASAPPPEITITFNAKIQDAPFTGRVFVIAAKSPISGCARQNWFSPHAFFASNVVSWQPGQTFRFEATDAFPQPMAKLPAGKYYFQAIMDRDLGSRDCLAGAGNAYSQAVAQDWPLTKSLDLHINQVQPERKFTEKPNVKLVDIPSPLLSEFHRKPMRMRAGVVLPKSYHDSPMRSYPAVYVISGFGGDHHSAQFMESRTDVDGIEMIHVALDADCRTGHHVFAD